MALDWLGEEGLLPELAPLTGSEDFSFMLEKCPGSYLIVGNGTGEHHATGGCMVHNPGYDFNDAMLPIAASYLGAAGAALPCQSACDFLSFTYALLLMPSPVVSPRCAGFDRLVRPLASVPALAQKGYPAKPSRS